MLTQRQQEIIEASIELIAEKGIQGLTMKNISKEIGISEPAIYRHYDNKIEILKSILDYFFNNMKNILESELNSESTAFEKISNIFNRHFKSFSEKPQLLAVIFSEELFRNETSLSNKVAAIMEQNTLMVQNILEKGQQNAEVDPNLNPKHLAVMIMGSLRLLAKQWQISGYAFNLTQEGAAMFETIRPLISIK
ncbi:MAG: TetR/AcrR family transcriptional regulator [Bacteroidales bacterium]|nr:TetR/AcrR family transcriptional regulator [Bacteroidales bacterium]